MRSITRKQIGRRDSGRGDARAVAAAIARDERIRPRGEARQPRELADAVEAIERHESRRVAHEPRVRHEEERREGLTLDDDAGVYAPVEPDVATVGIELAGEKAGGGVPAVDDRRPRFAQAVASFTALRYVSRSARPTSRSPVSGRITVGMPWTPSFSTAVR
jgi:hypothetical protein